MHRCFDSIHGCHESIKVLPLVGKIIILLLLLGLVGLELSGLLAVVAPLEIVWLLLVIILTVFWIGVDLIRMLARSPLRDSTSISIKG